jgi:L-fucose mutarotase/ribose pyranase (RbsD/FucU family)
LNRFESLEKNAMKFNWGMVALLAVVCVAGAQIRASDEATASTAVLRRIHSFGHRNWIVIADSAYPAQTSSGIETVTLDIDQLSAVKGALAEIEDQIHVKPNIYLDAELKHVPEADAPGVTKYREDLAKLLGAQKTNVLPHDEIIAKLDEAGKTFKVLILKTKLAIPYTSVFIQLDCKYWNADAEKRLREAMGK